MPRETKAERQAREAKEHEEYMTQVRTEYPANLMAALDSGWCAPADNAIFVSQRVK